MTKPNSSEIIMIIDRSGSMSSCWNDTVGGINEFIKKNREIPGECKISLVFFDDKYEMPFNGINIQDAMFSSPMTLADYSPRGSTALLDAVGKTINDVGRRLKSTPEDQRPSKVMVCIVTDGEENSSREYNGATIKDMITHQTDKYQWDFTYLGANQDAFTTGQAMGIKGINCANYNSHLYSGHAFAAATMRSCVSRSGGVVGSMASYYSSSLADAGIQDDLNPSTTTSSSDSK